MKLLLFLASLMGVTVCENPHNDLTVVIEMAILDADVNRDGIISEQEFLDEFIAKWDSDIPSDYALSQHDFVEGWTRRYGDNHKDTTTFFHSLDSDDNGELTADDLTHHWPQLDADGNSEVTTEEFGAFIRAHDFVEGWTRRYGDNHKDTTTFFHSLDSDDNGELTADDLTHHWPQLDADGNSEVTTEEFGAFIRALHPCGQHGHLGC